MRPLTVMIIADEPRRSRTKKILSSYHNVTIVGELISTTSFHLVTHLAPDLVIIDSLAVAINPIYALLALQSMPHTPLAVVLCATNHIQERKFWVELGVTADLTLEPSDELEGVLRQIILPVPIHSGAAQKQLGVRSSECLSV